MGRTVPDSELLFRPGHSSGLIFDLLDAMYASAEVLFVAGPDSTQTASNAGIDPCRTQYVPLSRKHAKKDAQRHRIGDILQRER